jgi:hypothetical protein
MNRQHLDSSVLQNLRDYCRSVEPRIAAVSFAIRENDLYRALGGQPIDAHTYHRVHRGLHESRVPAKPVEWLYERYPASRPPTEPVAAE